MGDVVGFGGQVCWYLAESQRESNGQGYVHTA